MSKAKTTQKETPPAVGSNPAAGASGDNVPAVNPEIIPILAMCKETVIVVCGTAEALPLLKKAWEQKAAPATILPREVGSVPFSKLIISLLAEEDIPDTFVLVPANCFPTHRVGIADLSVYRTRRTLVQTNPEKWTNTSDTRLPVLLEAAAALKTLEILDNDDTFTAEEFFKKYNGIAHASELAEEVGMAFGNTVAYVDRATPCMAKVSEALLRKKFICTTAEGFTPIKERLALLYGGE